MYDQLQKHFHSHSTMNLECGLGMGLATLLPLYCVGNGFKLAECLLCSRGVREEGGTGFQGVVGCLLLFKGLHHFSGELGLRMREDRGGKMGEER